MEYQVMKFLNQVIGQVVEKLASNPAPPNSNATLYEFIDPSQGSSFPPTPDVSPIKRDRSDYYTILDHVHEILCEEIDSIPKQIMETSRSKRN